MVVLSDPSIQIALQVFNRRVDPLAKHHAVELIEHRLVKALDDAVGLRTPGLGARVVDVLHRQIELVFMPLGVTAILRASIGEHAA